MRDLEIKEKVRYIILLLLSIFGNPFYQMVAYIICSELGLTVKKGTNVYQVYLSAFLVILLLIFIIRVVFYSTLFKRIEFNSWTEGKGSFLYIFARQHAIQAIGFFTFFLWISELEGNIIGFLLFPLTLLAGSVVSFIVVRRLFKTKKELELQSLDEY